MQLQPEDKALSSSSTDLKGKGGRFRVPGLCFRSRNLGQTSSSFGIWGSLGLYWTTCICCFSDAFRLFFYWLLIAIPIVALWQGRISAPAEKKLPCHHVPPVTPPTPAKRPEPSSNPALLRRPTYKHIMRTQLSNLRARLQRPRAQAPPTAQRLGNL